jgi:hypothetical protein
MQASILNDGKCQSAAIIANTFMGWLADKSNPNLSKSDRQSITKSKCEVHQATLRTHRILRRHWRFVEWSAHKLFCELKLTHPEAEAYLRRYRLKITIHVDAKPYAKIRRKLLDGLYSCPGMGKATYFSRIPTHRELADRTIDIHEEELHRLKRMAKRR